MFGRPGHPQIEQVVAEPGSQKGAHRGPFQKKTKKETCDLLIYDDLRMITVLL